MLVSVISFIVILGLLVFVHELGHFITAKRMGVRVDEFGFGFPPRIFGIRRKGTLYSLNWIPLGGFVKIKGEAGEFENDPDSFSHKKAWQRISILSAGVFMNFILAFVLLSVGFMIGMPQELGDDAASATARDIHILVIEVEKGSPAEAAHMQAGDILQSLDGNSFNNPDDVIAYIQNHANSAISIDIKRGAADIQERVTPASYGNHPTPLLGIKMARTGTIHYGFFESWSRGAQATIVLIGLILAAFWGLLSSLLHGIGVGDQISGPVGVAVLTGQVAHLGLPYLINFAAMLSINLGILNIIPFPALDGGRVLFVILEKIKGRPINARVEGVFHTIGFSLLILLVLVVTYRDIMHYGADILRSLRNLVS